MQSEGSLSRTRLRRVTGASARRPTLARLPKVPANAAQLNFFLTHLPIHTSAYEVCNTTGCLSQSEASSVRVDSRNTSTSTCSSTRLTSASKLVMDNPSAPHKPSAGPSSALRSRARLRPHLARPSSGTPLVKGKDVHQPLPHATSGEPLVKRRKRSLPSDNTPLEGFKIAVPAYDTNVDSVGHQKVASVPIRRRTPRKKPAPSPIDHATAPLKQMSVNSGEDTGVPSPTELEQLALQHNEGIHEQVLQQKRKISKLEAELVKEREFTEEAQKRVKQDMLLDIMREHAKLKKVEDAADIAKRRHEKEVSEYKVKLEKAIEKSLMERSQTLSAQSTAESYRLDTEHLQHVSDTLQTDLEELRVVEVEDKRARKDGRRDLPPAYGNLDDEERFPPYSQHADAGSIEIAHIKREIRRKFGNKIDEALAKPEKGSNTFCRLSVALEEVSQDLNTILETAKDVPVSHAHAQSNRYITQQMRSTDISEQLIAMKERLPTTPAMMLAIAADAYDKRGKTTADKRTRRKEHKATRPTLTLIQNANAAPYVADRITKLLLDLLWRTVSACELRPRPRNLNALMFGPSLTVMHTSVDEVFAAALRLTFSKSHSLTAFQYYLTQLEMVAKKFKTLGAEMTGYGVHNGLSHFNFFSKTLLWLNEQVEKERELRANDVQVPRDEKPVPFDGLEDDGVSSRWEGSESGSSTSEETA